MPGQGLSPQDIAYALRDAADVARQASAPEGGETSRPKALGGLSKRLFDVLMTSVAVIFLLPAMIVIALAVRAYDGGPALYRQERVGLGGRRFGCLKFRSMRVGSERALEAHLAASPAAASEWALCQKLRVDPRVTPIGRFLRKTSLDELPQLFNILRGDMSLVGPRPVVPSELERYRHAKGCYLRARPGLTGLWQISGRSLTTYERRIELDQTYIKNWRFLGDISIILHTIPALLLRGGAV
jgi:lipopolysaccharide/colanic/teichoic acid biosynthesis glycosyltransferase